MKNNCLSELAMNASGKLQPQILSVINSFLENDIFEITANMVKDKCFSINSNINWSGRIPAICNGMRNSLACGAIVISENRDFGGFTIKFKSNNSPNFYRPKTEVSENSNSINIQNSKFKNTQTEFIDSLIDTLYVFSPKGRDRIYKDLTKLANQILCKEDINGEILNGITAFGNPNRILIEKMITKKYPNSDFIDNDVKWELTHGVKFNLEESRKAANLIITYLSKLYNLENSQYKLFIEIFLNQLRGNNSSLLSKLYPLKYKSKMPGSRLVGKQTSIDNSTDFGFVEEHVIPVKFYFSKILSLIKTNTVENEIDKIFSKLFLVKLNTDDDLKLKRSGLNSKMPPNWTWDDDPLERYWFAKIDKNSLLKI